jgi:hypothetical protein
LDLFCFSPERFRLAVILRAPSSKSSSDSDSDDTYAFDLVPLDLFFDLASLAGFDPDLDLDLLDLDFAALVLDVFVFLVREDDG